MHTINASEFKAKCLALMDEVADTRQSIVITKNGKPVAELRPYSGKRIASPFGIWKEHVTVTGDIISPLDDVEWDALK